MTYFSVNFPEEYNDNPIFLKDILTEDVGMKFCLVLMRTVLDAQVICPDQPDIKIMSQLYIPVRNV